MSFNVPRWIIIFLIEAIAFQGSALWGKSGCNSGWCGSDRAGTGLRGLSSRSTRRLVAAVDQPAIGLEKYGGPQETIAVPPMAWAS